jgi:hypothetical protein
MGGLPAWRAGGRLVGWFVGRGGFASGAIVGTICTLGGTIGIMGLTVVRSMGGSATVGTVADCCLGLQLLATTVLSSSSSSSSSSVRAAKGLLFRVCL